MSTSTNWLLAAWKEKEVFFPIYMVRRQQRGGG